MGGEEVYSLQKRIWEHGVKDLGAQGEGFGSAGRRI